MLGAWVPGRQYMALIVLQVGELLSIWSVHQFLPEFWEVLVFGNLRKT